MAGALGSVLTVAPGVDGLIAVYVGGTGLVSEVITDADAAALS